MSYLGILHPSAVNVSFLRQHIIYFDKLYVPGLDHFLAATSGSEVGEFNAKNIEELIKLKAIENIQLSTNEIDNIISTFSGLSHDQRKELAAYLFSKTFSPLSSSEINIKDININELSFVEPSKFKGNLSCMQHPIAQAEYESIGSDVLTRAYASKLLLEGTNAIPLINDFKLNTPIAESKDVVSVVINEFPVPDKDVSLEKILEFKEQNVMLRISLRVWMKNIASKEYQFNEFKEELADILETYKDSLKKHKIKFRNQVIKSILLTPFEMIEGLIKLTPSKSVKSIFNIFETRESLSEQESKLPGREVAYIINANEKFKSSTLKKGI